MDSGYTVSHYDEAMILQEVAKISSEIIIAADYSKFNVKGFARLGDLTMAKKVITNTQIPNDYKKYFLSKPSNFIQLLILVIPVVYTLDL